MSSLKPVYEFEVTDERMEKARVAYEHALGVLGREVVIDVFMELGFGDALGYEPTSDEDAGHFLIDMTKVQFCALAAGLAAVVERGGVQRLSDAVLA